MVSKDKIDQIIMQEVEEQLIQTMKEVRENIYKKRSPESLNLDFYKNKQNNNNSNEDEIQEQPLTYQLLFHPDQIEVNYQVYKKYFENQILD